jgi:hypothetical protein
VHDISPFEIVTGLLDPPVQLFHQHQGEEAAKDATLDALTSLVKNRPRVENRLHIPEDLLDGPSISTPIIEISSGREKTLPSSPTTIHIRRNLYTSTLPLSTARHTRFTAHKYGQK